MYQKQNLIRAKKSYSKLLQEIISERWIRNFFKLFTKKNYFLGKDVNKYFNNIDKLKKIYFEQDNSNLHSINNKIENVSIPSYKNNYKSYKKRNNYTSIKIKNNNSSKTIIKKSNYLLLDYKNNIRSKNNCSIEKPRENQ